MPDFIFKIGKKSMIYIISIYLLIIKIFICDDVENNQIMPITSEIVYGITFDGVLYAIDLSMRKVIWSRRTEKLINTTPSDSDYDLSRLLIPNPVDGSLFSVINHKTAPRLNKIYRSIPELVVNPPLISHVGLIQLGNKLDIYEELCADSGDLIYKLTPDELKPSEIFGEFRNSLLIHKTRFNLAVHMRTDLKNLINITFYKYNFYDIDFDYKYIFLTSSLGFLAVLDTISSIIMLKILLNSPMIHIFKNIDKKLFKLSLFYISDAHMRILYFGAHFNLDGAVANVETHFLTKFNDYNYVMPGILIKMPMSLLKVSKAVKLPDLAANAVAVGDLHARETDHPSYLIFNEYLDLIETKNDDNINFGGENFLDNNNFGGLKIDGLNNYILKNKNNFGALKISGLKNIHSKNNFLNNKNNFGGNNINGLKIGAENLGGEKYNGLSLKTKDKIFGADNNINNKKYFSNLPPNIIPPNIIPPLSKELKMFPFLFSFTLVIVTFLSIFFFSFYKRKDYEYQKLLAITKNIGEGKFQIRKIKFDSNKILGQGSDGTCIFVGTFEDRPVAVKRILSASTEIANQEVMALCESDQHPNVIRYFSTENDHQFYYIALELCQFTLYEFIKNNVDKCGLDHLTVLKETSSGLSHLHMLRIVHRDLKPHNILISLPNTLGISRVLISDFGLCKKIPLDRSALSNRTSNLVGTSGWMAPEILEQSSHPLTFSSDIFSLGCIFYFVLSNGFHPFGDSLNRQFNIQSKQYSLNNISKEFNKYEAIDLISNMISHIPSTRLKTENVLGHLFFWSQNKRIQFLQDFSNYIEDLSNNHPHILRLEENSLEIVRGSWSFHIPKRILEDLTYHRDYSHSSVRDLIRAIRNKASHLKESPKDIKEFFKGNPNNLIKFFSDVFPRFLLHSYKCAVDLEYSNLDVFRHYFMDLT